MKKQALSSFRPFAAAFAAILIAGLMLAALPPTALPAIASALSWTSLDGPGGGPAQALALSPNFASDHAVLGGGGHDFGRASWGGRGIFHSSDGGFHWSFAGGAANGAVLDLTLSPGWPAHGVGAAAFWQGVWVTTDAGASWQQTSGIEIPGSPFLVDAVAVSPDYAHDFSLLAGSAYGGIFRTTDGGAIWSLYVATGPVRRVAYQPTQAAIALAAASDGLWRSSDHGANWSRAISDTQILDVAFQPLHDVAYATFAQQVWRSTDAGASWHVFGGQAYATYDQIGVSTDGTGLFTAAGPVLYRYDAGAGAFQPLPASLAGKGIMRLAVSPTFAADHTLLAGTLDGVWISTDGGLSFSLSDGFYPLPVNVLAAEPGYDGSGDLFAAGDMGVWRYQNGAWHPTGPGLLGVLAARITDVAVSPAYAGDDTVFAARGSSVSIGGNLFKSTNRGNTWELKKNAAYVAQVQPSPAFASDQRAFMLADSRVHYSTDGGETWDFSPFWMTYPNAAYRFVVSPGFAADQTLIAAGNNLYRSTDAGLTWQPAPTPPPIIPPASGSGWQVNRLIAATANSYFLAIYRYDLDPPYPRHDQLWRSDDGGLHWTQVLAAPDRAISAVAARADFVSAPTIYLATVDPSTFDETPIPSDLYRSTDNGLSWQNLGGLPDGSQMNTLLTTSGLPTTLFVGSENGAWQLETTGAPTATPEPCTELLANRGFEFEGGWRIPTTAYPARRTTEKHYHGAFSMLSGITIAGDNRRSYSDFSQDVVLPATGSLSLSLWRWPQAGPTSQTRAAVEPNLSRLLSAETLEEFHGLLNVLAGDLQYGMVITQPGNKIHYLFARLDDNRAWISQSFDMSAFAGQSVRLQFGAYNDGASPVNAQYFDLFSLRACQATATPSPTAIVSPTATTTPTTTASATMTPVLVPAGWLPLLLRGFDRPTPTPTTPATATPTASPTNTPESTATLTATHESTRTPTATATATTTPTATATPLQSFTFGPLYPHYAIAQATIPESLYVLDTLGRVLRSSDGGGSWTDLAVSNQIGGPGQTLGGGFVSPFQLWLGSGNGLYESHDAGQFWNKVTSFRPQTGAGVDFDDPAVLWDGGMLEGSYFGVIRSTNGGETWDAAGLGIDDYSSLGYNILAHPQAHNMLFAIVWGRRGVIHLYRGQTPGTWSDIASPITTNPFPAPLLLGLALRSHDGTLWAGGVNGALLYSDNPLEMSGESVVWQQATSFGPNHFAQPLAWGAGPTLFVTLHRYTGDLSNGYIEVGGAFLRSRDGGQTWVQLHLPVPD